MKIVTHNLEDIVFVEKPIRWSFQDLEGQQFGRLIVIGHAGRIKGSRYWWCQCTNEGNITLVQASHLKSGTTTSCGCYQKETKTTHGLEGTPEYNAYISAKDRCQNSNNKKYKNYGGRGIEFRFESFEQFYEELGEKPEPKREHSVERIDVNGHYEIGNVEWNTSYVQSRNKTDNYFITYNGETKCITDWATELNFNLSTIRDRLRRGWCELCSLSIPPNKKGQLIIRCLH